MADLQKFSGLLSIPSAKEAIIKAFFDSSEDTALRRSKKEALRGFNDFMNTDTPAQAVHLLLSYGQRAAETLVGLYREHLLMMELTIWVLPSPAGRLSYQEIVAVTLIMD